MRTLVPSSPPPTESVLKGSRLVLACSRPDTRQDEIDTPSARRKKPVGSSSEPYGRLNRTPRAIEAKPTGSYGKPVGLFERSSRASGTQSLKHATLDLQLLLLAPPYRLVTQVPNFFPASRRNFHPSSLRGSAALSNVHNVHSSQADFCPLTQNCAFVSEHCEHCAREGDKAKEERESRKNLSLNFTSNLHKPL